MAGGAARAGGAAGNLASGQRRRDGRRGREQAEEDGAASGEGAGRGGGTDAVGGSRRRRRNGRPVAEPSRRRKELMPFAPSKWDGLVQPILADHLVLDLGRIFPSRIIPSYTSLYPNSSKNRIDLTHLIPYPTNQTQAKSLTLTL
ncbi:hypothetical protein OsI_18745 [Oryza sativa Indica Group]|uniref:GW-5 n=1 Tax=Oryza sativa subsp. indica TaxID=39946 RepID=A0A175_ORYSI|nr:GW-5 [Oryza sativa Indica Group]EAY96821.1 hypothetical protein OsI_18745 [Oryza sativa Indica Group]